MTTSAVFILKAGSRVSPTYPPYNRVLLFRNRKRTRRRSLLCGLWTHFSVLGSWVREGERCTESRRS